MWGGWPVANDKSRWELPLQLFEQLVKDVLGHHVRWRGHWRRHLSYSVVDKKQPLAGRALLHQYA